MKKKKKKKDNRKRSRTRRPAVNVINQNVLSAGGKPLEVKISNPTRTWGQLSVREREEQEQLRNVVGGGSIPMNTATAAQMAGDAAVERAAERGTARKTGDRAAARRQDDENLDEKLHQKTFVDTVSRFERSLSRVLSQADASAAGTIVGGGPPGSDSDSD